MPSEASRHRLVYFVGVLSGVLCLADPPRCTITFTKRLIIDAIYAESERPFLKLKLPERIASLHNRTLIPLKKFNRTLIETFDAFIFAILSNSRLTLLLLSGSVHVNPQQKKWAAEK